MNELEWVLYGGDLVLVGPEGQRRILIGLPFWRRLRWAIGDVWRHGILREPR